MKKFQFLSFVAIAAFAFMVGCDSKNADNTSEGGTSDSGEHVHDDGTVHKGHDEEGHAHGEGPHGGTVADWGGGKFHVEFTVDHDKQEAIVYILGDDEKTATPIDAEEVTLQSKIQRSRLPSNPALRTEIQKARPRALSATMKILASSRNTRGRCQASSAELPIPTTLKSWHTTTNRSRKLAAKTKKTPTDCFRVCVDSDGTSSAGAFSTKLSFG